MNEKRDRRDPAPPSTPADAVDPDLEQEGEVADQPGSGWAAAAGSAAHETTLETDDDR